MSDATVVITDPLVSDCSIERDALDGVATIEVLETDDDAVRAEQLARADALLNHRLPIDAGMIDQLEDCRIIARYGIGVDNVDVSAATDRGIVVTNVPDYCIEEVANHTTALILNLVRRIKQYDAVMQAGEWDTDEVPPITERLSAQTVGIVGFGRIGRAVGERIGAFTDSIVTSDPYLEPADIEDYPATMVPFDVLVERSDVITIHCPLTEDTRGRFDAATFDRMKETAYLVNVARGPIVDQAALVNALDAGDIAGAGLDVYDPEPPDPDHVLRTHERVVTTPHVAWYSEAAIDDRRRKAANEVKRVLTHRTPTNRINDVE